MMGTHDYKKFAFAGGPDGHLVPIHHRELGKRVDGVLYNKKVSWADVVINEVPIEMTIRYEDSIDKINATDKTSPSEPCVVNARKFKVDYLPEEDYPYENQWAKRLNKMNMSPFTFKDVKKKKKSIEKWPVKSKSQKEVREEKTNASAEKFVNMTDTNDHGKLNECQFSIFDANNNYVKYCPPQHWVEPIVKWECIWREMDQISTGIKRKHKYLDRGETNEDGIVGPAIYFFDDSEEEVEEEYDSEEEVEEEYDSFLLCRM